MLKGTPKPEKRVQNYILYTCNIYIYRYVNKKLKLNEGSPQYWTKEIAKKRWIAL